MKIETTVKENYTEDTLFKPGNILKSNSSGAIVIVVINENQHDPKRCFTGFLLNADGSDIRTVKKTLVRTCFSPFYGTITIKS